MRQMQTVRYRAIITVVCWLALTLSIQAATYYVSPTGDDANPGTLELPWKNVTKANQAVQPGDTVYLRGGEYKGQTIRPAVSGAEGNYITYARYEDEMPRFTNTPVAVNLQSRSYIRI